MMEEKILIVTLRDENKFDLAKRLSELDDSLTISPIFSSDISLKDSYKENIYYMSNDDVNLAFKNNALLYVMTDNYISTGITVDDFYNNDIIVATIEEFNNIPDKFFEKYSITTIWLDSRNHDKLKYDHTAEAKYLMERISTLRYMYFLDESIYEVAYIIYNYIKSPIDKKQSIIYENQ